MIYTLSQKIEEEDRNLARNKLIQSVYPDANLVITEPPRYGVDPDPTAYNHYISPTVNTTYTHLQFKDTWSVLYMQPYCVVEFDYNGQQEFVKVFSNPQRKKLANIKWSDKDRTIYFTKATLNTKSFAFKDSLASDCIAGIKAFSTKHVNSKLNLANLNPRLQQLLAAI